VHDLIPLPPAALTDGALTQADIDGIEYYRLREKSEATLAAYGADLKQFVHWCAGRNLSALPAHAATVCAHIADIAKGGYAVASIGRRLAGIAYAHEIRGLEDPTQHKTVKVVMAGIRHDKAGAAKKQKTPLLADAMQKMLDSCGSDLVGVRDRALLALGFACALRRSEIVALCVADLEAVPDGLRIRIQKSKTDQSGVGQIVALPRGVHMRPVEAVERWLEAAAITAGPIFPQLARGGPAGFWCLPVALSGHAVARIVKSRAARIGLNPATVAGHSLRSGFLTSAAESGDGVFKLCEVSRHRSIDTLSGYVRSADLFKARAGSAFL
jgi:site-specific recombinase XerD